MALYFSSEAEAKARETASRRFAGQPTPELPPLSPSERAATLVSAASQIVNAAPRFEDAIPDLENLIISQGLEIPAIKAPVGLVLRTLDPIFWERRLVRQAAREAEHRRIRNGLVSGKTSPYASKAAVAAFQEREAAHREWARDRLLISDQGEVLSFSDLLDSAEASRSRFSELLCRIYGCQAAGHEAGHEAALITITAPSRFHAVSRRYSAAETPRTTQKYLNDLWARARAAFKRADLSPYGLRIAEPHRDATPHWHFLLWAPAAELEEVVEILRAYSLEDSPNEPGAQRRRFTVEKIDRERGSAVGYVLKYVCKNLGEVELPNGDSLNGVLDQGKPAGSTAEALTAIRTWASLWGIRQFQFIGTAPVGQWRELRRLRDPLLDFPVLEALRQRADEADWRGYDSLFRQKKPELVKACDALTALRSGDEKAAAEALNRYGEPVFYVRGLRVGEEEVVTRKARWVLASLSELLEKAKKAVEPLRSRLLLAVERYASSASASERASGAPWNLGNNCTSLGLAPPGSEDSEFRQFGFFSAQGAHPT